MIPSALTCNRQSNWANAGKLIGVCLGILLLCLPAFSQLNYGRIFGAITDQSGGAIAGATVTVVDVQRGVSRILTADSAGGFSAPSLIPGTYTVRAEFKGFKTLERSDIVIEVGQDIRVDLSLQTGEQTETVTVTGEPPEINTTNAQLGGTIENQIVSDLPVSGRTFTGLLAYQPGVVAKPGSTANSYISNGGRPQQQVWMLDGLYDINVYHGAAPNIGGQGGPSVNQSNFLPIDSVQEVTVTESPKAEYGWKPGAQVNVGLKSGSNSIHGTAVAFGNDASLDAKNPFLSSTQPKATTVLEQFGGSIGGPIKKDKLFYFASYEGQRYTVGFPRIITVPSTAQGLGAGNSFPDAIAGVLAAKKTLNPLSLSLAGCTAAGVCNAANGLFGNSSNSPTITFAPNSTGAVDNAVGKIDYHINQHNSLNGELYIDEGNFVSSNVTPALIQPYWVTGVTNKTAVVRGVWDWIPNSTWLNEARFGWDYANTPILTLDCSSQPLGAPNYSSFGFVSGAPQCGFPQVTVTGFGNLGGTNNAQTSEFGTYAISDSLSYTRGKHLFKFGAEVHLSHWDGGQYKFGKGSISFGGAQIPAVFTGATALEDFLVGVPSSGSLLLGNPVRSLSYKEDGFFAQDDWRLTPRLTLNLGLRYEYLLPVRDDNNLFANFDPTAPAGLIQQTSGQSVYNGDKNNFEPRLGLAWDVTGKGRTVVRAGGGLAYEVIPLLLLIGGTQGAALNAIPTGFKLVNASGGVVPSPGTINTGSLSLVSSQLSWAPNVPVFNSSAGALACGNGLSGNPSPCPINVIDPNFRLTWVANWTVGVQHAFTDNLSLSLAYVGNHGREQGIKDINAATPGASGATSEQPRRPYYSTSGQFPYLGAIQYVSNFEYSNYDGLQATLTKRTSHGLSFLVGYTYSHSLDVAADAENSNLVMDARNPQLDYGSSGFDTRHALTLAGSYRIPGFKAPGQLLEGWQLNSGVIMMGAFPWNAIDTSDDLSGVGDNQDRWTLAGNPKDFTPGARATIPCYGLTTSTVFTAKNGCTVGATLPAPCVAAAAAEPINPSLPLNGGTFELNRLGCYMEGSAVIVPPSQGTFGTMGKDVMRGVPFYNWDLSIFKNWKFKERLTAQFQTEFFNLLNHPQYQLQGQGATTVTNSLGTPVSFGQAASLAGSGSITGTGFPRRVQFGLKLIF